MPTHTSLVVLVSQPTLASSPGCLPPAFFTCFSHCKWWKLGCLCHFQSLMQLQKRKPGHIWYRHTGSSARKRNLRLFLATFAGGQSQHQYHPSPMMDQHKKWIITVGIHSLYKSALCYSCLTSQHMTRSPRPSPSALAALAAKLKVTKALEQGYLSASHFLANWEATFEARFTLCVCVCLLGGLHIWCWSQCCALCSLSRCASSSGCSLPLHSSQWHHREVLH